MNLNVVHGLIILSFCRPSFVATPTQQQIAAQTTAALVQLREECVCLNLDKKGKKVQMINGIHKGIHHTHA